LSSVDLRRSAAALQAETAQLSSSENTGHTSPQHRDDGHVDTDSSQDDVAMETSEDVAMETTMMRRHDSLKVKKRVMLAALAEKRLQAANETTHNDRYMSLKLSLTFVVCYDVFYIN